MCVLSSDWYTLEYYKRLKRSVTWTVFTPEEHPLKHLTYNEIQSLLVAHKEDQTENFIKNYQINEEKSGFHIPSFLIETPNEYYVDENFKNCLQKPFIYPKYCRRSDIWAITRTLSWSDCARNIRNITYSALSLVQCDSKNFGRSCMKSKNYTSLLDYSDIKNQNIGFISDTCNTTIGSAECTYSCNDNTTSTPVKINSVKIISREIDFYSNLQSGSGLIVGFSSNSDIINYRSGIFDSSGELIFHGRVVGYKTYNEKGKDRMAIIAEMGFDENWGEKGNIILANTLIKWIYNLSSR